MMTTSSGPDWGDLRTQAQRVADLEPPGSQLRAAAIKLVVEIEARMGMPRSYASRAERRAKHRRSSEEERYGHE